MQPAARERTLDLSLVIVSVAAVLIAAEVGLRIHAAFSGPPSAEPPSSVPLHIRVDSPELYRLNPEHPSISSQGLRNREIPFLKPMGARRILVLGDSVTYGPAVPPEKAFPARLEALLRAEGHPAEVINAGVPGYTPYNELQYFRSRGRYFDADVVMVVFCMNDVADPRLHWRSYAELGEIPAAAIPNPVYDREVILPRVARERGRSRWLDASFLLREVTRRLRALRSEPPEGVPDLRAKTPTFITGEDDLGIDVLMDERSPEWNWLRNTYEQLQTDVEAHGATFVIAIAPVAYQLDAGYPYRPQTLFRDYCERRSIACIDLLDSMSGHPKEELFLMERLGDYDVWHLMPAGHEIVAQQMADFFESRPDLL